MVVQNRHLVLIMYLWKTMQQIFHVAIHKFRHLFAILMTVVQVDRKVLMRELWAQSPSSNIFISSSLNFWLKNENNNTYSAFIKSFKKFVSYCWTLLFFYHFAVYILLVHPDKWTFSRTVIIVGVTAISRHLENIYKKILILDVFQSILVFLIWKIMKLSSRNMVFQRSNGYDHFPVFPCSSRMQHPHHYNCVPLNCSSKLEPTYSVTSGLGTGERSGLNINCERLVV